MRMLARLIKVVIGAAMRNKAVRSALIVALIKTVKWTIRPSTRSRIMAFFTNLIKSVPGSSKRKKDQIIDLDEYTIVDDRH